MSEKNELVEVQTSSLASVNAAEIDMQIATARKYPRDEERAIEKSVRLATTLPKIAQACQYFRPVGIKNGIQQFADGPSVRLAEIMKTTWGNIRIAKRVIGTRDGSVGVEWAVHDLESNMMDRGEVWRPYFGKEKMISVVTAAAMKFAERDAVFAAVPKAYADRVLAECRKAIVGDDQERNDLLDALLCAFEEMGVTREKVYSSIDRRKYPVGTDEEIVFLLGLNNAIKDGICSVQDAFGGEVEDKSSKPANVKVETGKPTEQLRKDKGWISDSQEKRLYAACKKRGITVEDLKAAIKDKWNLDHLYQLSTVKEENGHCQYDLLCAVIEKKPDSLKNYTAAKETVKTATTEAAQPCMLDKLNSAIKFCGLSNEQADSILFSEFGYSIANPPVEEDPIWESILLHFQNMADGADTAGA